jgi:hypothetical protein
VDEGFVDELHGEPPVSTTRWLHVWTRAVVGPASRQAGGVWAGVLVVAAVVFGPTGLAPHDLTELSLHAPMVGAVLAVTWLLLFVPIARRLVRAEPARYLRALPGPTVAPIAVTIAALLGLQLPWLALWILGEGALGFVLALGLTLVIVAIAWWRPPARRIRIARWRGELSALRAVYLRAVGRRAGDAIVRGAGLAVLAGVFGGLLVTNNQLEGQSAAVLGGAAITIALVPAQAGVLLTLLDAHRQAAWLAASTGIAESTRVIALAMAVAVVYVVAAVIALAAELIGFGGDGWMVLVVLSIALGSAAGATRALVSAEASPSAATRVVVGAVLAAAVGVLCLGMLGVAGIAAAFATYLLALGVRT